MEFIFTWAGADGPSVRRFENARDLLGFASGFLGDDAALILMEPGQRIEVRA